MTRSGFHIFQSEMSYLNRKKDYHYANVPLQCAVIFKGCEMKKKKKKFFAKNIDPGVLTSTHYLCFRAKI